NDRGVLLLSLFTGAARELEQALTVNPYDTEGFAGAIYQALEMPVEEQKVRLSQMRTKVAERNIYSWAEDIVRDVVELADSNTLKDRI
ncbi:MAG: trehalose-6-phosphate synthase, partial [bacterium]